MCICEHNRIIWCTTDIPIPIREIHFPHHQTFQGVLAKLAEESVISVVTSLLNILSLHHQTTSPFIQSSTIPIIEGQVYPPNSITDENNNIILSSSALQILYNYHQIKFECEVVIEEDLIIITDFSLYLDQLNVYY
jgi:hypothetical protein